MITPFNRAMQVDYAGLSENVEFQIGRGVSGLAPLGTTGESPTISGAERSKLLKSVIDKTNGRVPVIPGTGTNSTEHTVELTKEAEDLGADAALLVTPYYNRPSQEGIFRHFEAVSKAVDLPLMIYNIPGRTGVNIETQTLLRLSSLSNIVAVKEASGNISQMAEVIQQLPKSFTVLSGDDGITLPLMALGGRGVVSVVSNLLPKRVCDLTIAMLAGDVKGARDIHNRLMPIFKGAFIDTNPIPIKAAMKLAGMPAGGVRPPLCEMDAGKMEKLKELLLKYPELKRERN